MFSNPFLKITSNNISDRVIQTDNCQTYFTVSDFIDKYDGLWVAGTNLFSSLKLDNEDVKIIGKKISPIGIQINFNHRSILQCYLFKKNEGLLICLKNKSIIPFKSKKYKLIIKINTKFEISEKNINSFILKYENTEQNKDNVFCSFSLNGNFIIEKIDKTENGIFLSITSNGKNDNEPELLILSNFDCNNLKQKTQDNLKNIYNLKRLHLKNSMMPFKYTNFDTDNVIFNKAMAWSIISSSSFVMQKDDDLGIIAGFPWFDNFWGRDTFIALTGISLVSGRFEEAFKILETFTKYQCLDKKSKYSGRIPNLIKNKNDIIYNSSDATPLFIKSCYETFLYSGNFDFIISMWNTIVFAINECYIANKDKNNFIIQEEAEDWMDAKKDGKYSYSQRKEIIVEIQSLWYVALYSTINIAKEFIKHELLLPDTINIADLKKLITLYKKEAIKLHESFNKFFISENEPYIYDSISSDYKPDNVIRPNSILAFFYTNLTGIPPLINKDNGIKLLKFLSPELVFKHGISSLGKNDPNFHPYHISQKYDKDEAYHNGILWNWLSGAFTNISCAFNLHNFSFQQTLSLSKQILETGTLGTLSELTNPVLNEKENIVTSGTYSQAWSTGEFCRSFYQDYLGIRLNTPARTVYFSPAIPMKLGTLKVSIRMGLCETLIFWARIDRSGNNISFLEIKGLKLIKPVKLILKMHLGYEKEDNLIKNKFSFIKIILKESNDIIKINFSKVNQNLIKIREFSTVGKSELISIIKSTKSYNYKFTDNLQFASPILESELQNFKSLQ